MKLKRDSPVFKILQICTFLFGLFWFIGGLLIWLSLLFGVSVAVEYGTYRLFGMLLLMPLGIHIMFLTKKGVIEFGSDKESNLNEFIARIHPFFDNMIR